MPKKFFSPELVLIHPLIDHVTAVTTYLNQSTEKWLIQIVNQDGAAVSIDQVRSLRYQISFAQNQSQPLALVLLHVDDCLAPAQNALLKTLEEPPPNVCLILTAEQRGNVLPTIASRCQIVNLEATPEDLAAMAVLQTEAAAFWQSFLNCHNHAQIIELCESYSDRDQAQKLVSALISHHQRYLDHVEESHQDEAILEAARAVSRLLECQAQLKHNITVRLSLENALFDLKKPE